MNSNQENSRRKVERNMYLVRYTRSNGKRCGLPSEMKPAEDWRELFEKWGYTTWKQER